MLINIRTAVSWRRSQDLLRMRTCSQVLSLVVKVVRSWVSLSFSISFQDKFSCVFPAKVRKICYPFLCVWVIFTITFIHSEWISTSLFSRKGCIPAREVLNHLYHCKQIHHFNTDRFNINAGVQVVWHRPISRFWGMDCPFVEQQKSSMFLVQHLQIVLVVKCRMVAGVVGLDTWFGRVWIGQIFDQLRKGGVP